MFHHIFKDTPYFSQLSFSSYCKAKWLPIFPFSLLNYLPCLCLFPFIKLLILMFYECLLSLTSWCNLHSTKGQSSSYFFLSDLGRDSSSAFIIIEFNLSQHKSISSSKLKCNTIYAWLVKFIPVSFIKPPPSLFYHIFFINILIGK